MRLVSVCVVADTEDYHNNDISHAGVQGTANGALPREEGL